VKIGSDPTCALYRLPDTEAVHNWLSRLTIPGPEPGSLPSVNSSNLCGGRGILRG
jgi:hypothetical protein